MRIVIDQLIGFVGRAETGDAKSFGGELMAQPKQNVWFLNSHVTIQLAQADNADGMSVLLLRMARDDAPPLHTHRVEDEVFHIVSGEIRFQVGDLRTVHSAGQTVHAPQGIPHGFRVLSESAEMIVITHGGFERLVRILGRPALHDGPPEFLLPSPEMQHELAKQCAAQQIDVVGPPIS